MNSQDLECVAFKRALQERLIENWRGLSEEEIETQREEFLASDHPLAKKWRGKCPMPIIHKLVNEE